MASHSVLKPKEYVRFNPANKKHRQIYAQFRVEGRWPTDMRFMLEDPHTVVPTMCDIELVKYFLRREGTWPRERNEII